MASSTFGCAETPQSNGKRAVEVLFAERLGGQRVHAVQIAALVEAGQRGAAVHDDVGARRVLHQCSGAPAVVALGDLHRFGQSRPQRAAGFILGGKAVGADEPVAVERLSVPEADDVDHAVAVERVVELQRRVQRILGVAQIHPVEVARDFALHDGEVVGVPLGGLRSPRTGPVGVVVVLRQGGQKLADDLDIHLQLLSRSDDEADRGGRAAAEVQRAERLCALDLVLARVVADLFGGVEQHPHP